MDLSFRLLGDAANASGAFKDLGSAATVAGAVITKFGLESIKIFAESDKWQRQLRLAAGGYTEALNEQAEAMKEKFAVDDDAIRQMEVLLLRYGAAPAAIRPAIEAVLDFSAATGKDAKQALEQMVRGVESGSGSLGKMGVHFKTTGSFAGDLENAVDALGKKFAGAGEEDANSLDGRMRRASLAVDDLKKSFGGMFAELESKFGILDSMSKQVNHFTEMVEKHGLLQAILPMSDAAQRDEGAFNAEQDMSDLVVPLPPAMKRWDPNANVPINGDHAVGKDKHDDSLKKQQDQLDAYLNAENEYLDKKWVMDREAEEKQADHLEAMLAGTAKYEKEEIEHEEKTMEAKQKLADAELEMDFKKQEALARAQEKAQADQDRRFKHMEEQWRQAGDRMGAALVDAIGTQLLRLAEGGDVDPAEVAGDVASVILGIAGFAIGTYFGAPQVGGAIGGLAGGLAKAGIVAGFGRKNKKHEGGGIERFHSGGWPGLSPGEVPIIAQEGEHMLSRRNVADMGGPAGVERAKRGGGGDIHITTMDALSFTDNMSGRGGRAIYDAIRLGRGDLPILFSGG